VLHVVARQIHRLQTNAADHGACVVGLRHCMPSVSARPLPSAALKRQTFIFVP